MTGKNTALLITAGILLTLFAFTPPVAAAIITEYLNTNLPGSDYKTIDAPAKEGCAIACLNDKQCLAATWVNRAGQTPTCQLKNAVPSKTPASGDNILAMHSYIKNDQTTITQTTLSCSPAKAGFVADKTSGTVPLTIHFTDTTNGALETVWNWGDGSQQHAAPQSEVDHTYTNPGTYTVNLTVADDCGFSSATMIIEADEAGAAGSATLKVDSIPRGAMLSIDGNSVGATPVNLVVNLASGVHRLRISMPGYQDYTEDVTIQPGHVFDLKVILTKTTSGGTSPSTTLQPSTPAASASAPAGTDLKKALADLDPAKAASANTVPGTGILIVSSNPTGAAVYLDGKSGGTTPLTIPGVPAGQHNLLLTLQGYTEASRAVNISAGSENLVAVDMSATKKTPGFAALAGVLAVALLALFRRKAG